MRCLQACEVLRLGVPESSPSRAQGALPRTRRRTFRRDPIQTASTRGLSNMLPETGSDRARGERIQIVLREDNMQRMPLRDRLRGQPAVLPVLQGSRVRRRRGTHWQAEEANGDGRCDRLPRNGNALLRGIVWVDSRRSEGARVAAACSWIGVSRRSLPTGLHIQVAREIQREKGFVPRSAGGYWRKHECEAQPRHFRVQKGQF
mmetsp:Transcript_25672/g.54231  ORF Transcript_25672/g.54231 Transcript_25672/m.54231 type:complete len:204 (+) Transcript_25672:144-755(+)